MFERPTAILEQPETGTSFAPAPSPWDANTPISAAAISAVGGVAGKIQPQSTGGPFILDGGHLRGLDGATGDVGRGLGGGLGGGGGGGGGGLTTAPKNNGARLGGKKSKSQQQLHHQHQQQHHQQPAGMTTASEQQQQQQQNHSRSRLLSSSASLSMLQSPQQQQQAHQRQPLPHGRHHQALGRVSAGNRGRAQGGGAGGRGLALTPVVTTSSRVIKGGTRGLYAQVRRCEPPRVTFCVVIRT